MKGMMIGCDPHDKSMLVKSTCRTVNLPTARELGYGAAARAASFRPSLALRVILVAAAASRATAGITGARIRTLLQYTMCTAEKLAINSTSGIQREAAVRRTLTVPTRARQYTTA